MKNLHRSLGQWLGSVFMVLAAVGCSKSSGASGQGQPVAHPSSSFEETSASTANTLAWSTHNNISASRQIEVGDHPNIQLEKFEIGNRPQKVRFMIADDIATGRYTAGSPQDDLFKSDAPIAKSENTKWSLFAMVIDTPKNLGLSKFSDDSNYNGVTVSPQLMLCAAGALQNLKAAGATRARIFQNWQIGTVNIFVKSVQHADEAESKMAIDNSGKALNFQLSVWSRSGDCFLPSVTEIGEALDIADQRVTE